ncbi:hypothetical protein ABK040_009048 [Willaertia magna]
MKNATKLHTTTLLKFHPFHLQQQFFLNKNKNSFSTFLSLNNSTNNSTNKESTQSKLEKKISKIDRLFASNPRSNNKQQQKKNVVEKVVFTEKKNISPVQTQTNNNTGNALKSTEKSGKLNHTNNLTKEEMKKYNEEQISEMKYQKELKQFEQNFLNNRNLTPEQLQIAKDLFQPTKEYFTKLQNEDKLTEEYIISPIFGNRPINEKEIDKDKLNQLKGVYYYRTLLKLIQKQNHLPNKDKLTIKEYIKKQFRDQTKNQEEQYQIADNFIHRMRANELNSLKLDITVPQETTIPYDLKEFQYWNNYYQQHGFIEEWYCDWDLFKKYLPLNSLQKLYQQHTNSNTNNTNNNHFRILDVGCGVSNLSIHLLDYLEDSLKIKNCMIDNIDISNICIHLQTETYLDLIKLNIFNFRQLDIRDLSKAYLNETFNLIIDKATFDSILSFEDGDLNDIEKYEEEIYRVLKPGGLFILVSVIPLEGMKDLFSIVDNSKNGNGGRWSSIKCVGSKNLLEEHDDLIGGDNDNVSGVGDDTCQVKSGNKSLSNNDRGGSVLGDAKIHFYHIKKASE